MKKARSRPRAALAALALSTATLGVAVTAITTVLPAQADSKAVFAPAGQLVLRTGAVDRVEYGTKQQALATSGTCDLTSSGPSLLQFTGLLGTTQKKVGLRSDSIGVIESSLTALCNRVDVISLSSTETLELKLGSAMTNFAGKKLLATRASLDVEVQSWLGSKAKIQAIAKLGGATVGTFELTQGAKVADGSNVRFDIKPTGRFDSLSLKAVKGSFSLEGGADAGTSPTTFDIVSEVDAVLDCTTGSTYTEGNATVRHLGNADGSACSSFGVTVTAGDTSISFLKPLDVAPTAQFIFDIDWRLPAPSGPGITLPNPKIDFEVPGGAGEKPMPFCPSYLYDGSGALVGAVEPSDLTALQGLDMEPIQAGAQFACVGARTAKVAAGGATISDKIFLIGDARMRL